MADSRIGILLEARNNASGGIRQVTSDLRAIDGAAGIAAGGLTAMAAAAGIAGAIKLGQAVYDLAELGAQAELTRSSFDQMAAGVGEAGDEMLAKLQAASGGQIANTDLVLSANKAMLLGVADSSEELGQLLEVARVRGQAMGLSVQQAFNDLVTGLGRMSPLILDNLGIVTGGEKVFTDYAQSLGRSAESLTDAEKKQALFNKVVAESQGLINAAGDAAESPAASFARMDASIQNAKVALGELFSPAVAAIAEQIASAVSQATDALDENAKIGAENTLFDKGAEIAAAADEYNAALLAFQNAATSGEGGDLTVLGARIEGFTQKLQLLGAEYNRAAALTGAPLIDINQLSTGVVAFEQAAAAAAQLTDAQREANEASRAASAELEVYNAQLVRAGPILTGIASAAIAAGASLADMTAMLQNMRAEFNALEGAAGSARSSIVSAAGDAVKKGLIDQAAALDLVEQGYASVDDRAAALGRKLADGSLSQADYALQLELIDAGLTNEFDQLEENAAAAQRFNKALGSDAEAAAKQATAAIEAEYEALKGKVSGVLSEATSAGVGVNPQDIFGELGARSDAINEDARRLADIAVKGFESPWLAYFQEKFPSLYQQFFAGAAGQDGVRLQAAQLLQNFQDGLNPELIDKEQAKERVRRMIFGEQSMAALANEITAELSAELGGAVPANLSGLVNQSLGVGGAGDDLTGRGAGAATQFTDEFALSVGNSGGAAMRNLAESLRAEANLAEIGNSGRTAGERWGKGFMEVVGLNVPEPLLNLLASLVTPLVQGNISMQASLTGAR